MPPKKGEAILPAVPEVEDEVVLPEEVEAVPEPSFCFVLGHLSGHTFVVEEPQPPLAEGEEPPAEPVQPSIREFDPCGLITAKAKEAGDPLLKNVIVIEREDLQAVATAEEKTLSAALRQRLEKEKAARQRRKLNDARKAAIAAFEAVKASEEAGDKSEMPAPTQAAGEEQGPKADTLVLLRDYPSTAEDLEELSSEGLCGEGIVDLWAAVYIAGESLGDHPADTCADEYGEWPERPVSVAEPTEQVSFFYDAIHAARLNTDLANCTICTLPKTHTLAFAPPDVALVDHVNNAVLEAVGAEAASRQQFNSWLQSATRVTTVPDLSDKDKEGESRLYDRMMGSVDPMHHDVPLFLHCLTEQVSCNLGGEAEAQEDAVALSNLDQYLGGACMDILSNGVDPMRRPVSRDGPSSPSRAGPGSPTGDTPDSASVLPHLDRALCNHSLAGGGKIENGQPIIDAVYRVLQEVSVPGVKRSGLPADAIHSAAQREALKTRIYPFAPNLPASEFEQLLLLHAFEDLLNRAQPERKWRLDTRTYRERIPRDYLAQTLEGALRCEPFVSTAYLPRHDCLLVALHHRSLPGRVMWHSWKGDLAAPSASERWNNGLFMTPTYNDWAQIIGGNVPGMCPKAPALIDGLDGRQLGYVKTVEKLATPADGSVILVTRFDHGLKESFQFPCASALRQVDLDMQQVNILESGSRDDCESVITSIVGPSGNLAAAMAAQPKFDAPVRHSSRLARVMKDGLSFGIVHDTTWIDRRIAERDRRAALALGTSPTATGSRPASPAAMDEAAMADLPFSGYQFGLFWLSFADGARCTTRMHHERVNLFPDGGLGSDENLPPLGAMMTYTMAAGLVVQVFSDGAVRLMWPLAVASRDDGPAITPVLAAESSLRLPVGSKPYFMPGCPEDIEVMRTITPFGTVVRKLLSGRVEVFHADSTTAARNPTSEELHAQLADLRVQHGPVGSSRVELLERFCKVYAERDAAAPISSRPSAKEKAAGLPGHWVVVRPDGSLFGRVLAASQSSVRAASRASPAPGDGNPPGSAGAASPDAGARAEATPEPVQPLEQIMEGKLLAGGVVEYPISTTVSVATQVDLQTQHRTRTNSHGLASHEDPDGTWNVTVHADGTRVTKVVREGGNDIIISKEPMALVRCEINQSGVGMRMLVECGDGTQLDIVPQMQGPASGLLPLKPGVQDLDTYSTHAWVMVNRPDIASLVSNGTGQVEVLLGADAARAAYPDAEALRRGEEPSSGSAYVAQCAEARLSLRDPEGQEFVLLGDQTLSTDGVCNQPSSPRCFMPEVAYKMPGLEDDPPPADAMPPRLFVVYGNGDAEELIADNDALEVLKIASSDPQASVVEGEIMAAPLEGCRCHTIFMTKVMDGYAKPGAGASVESVTFSLGSLDSAWSVGSLGGSPTQAPAPTVTKFRQIIQFPAVTDDNHQKFLGTLKQYREWEQAELIKNRAVMAGPEDKKKGPDAAAKKKASKKEEKNKKKGKRTSAMDPSTAAASVVEIVLPKFEEDIELNVYGHGVDVLRIRQALLPEPTDKELLAKAVDGRDADIQKEVIGDVTTLAADGAAPPSATASPTAAPPPSPPPSAAPAEKPKEKPVMRSLPSGRADQTQPVPRASRPKMQDAPTFSYFKSEVGLQFLVDGGELDPDRKPPVRKEKTARPQQQSPKKRSPWNPLLLGEAPENEAHDGYDDQEQDQDAGDDTNDQGGRWQPAQESGYPADMQGQNAGIDEEDQYVQQQARLPIVAEDADTPAGPHPDKKSNLWNIKGEPRTQRPIASHAYVMLNTDYLEVEGATDRRVRTSSIAHKKNAGKAPSVSSIRKTGQHALASGTEIAAKEILGEMGLSNPEEHWKLTSTMQGLGDSNSLVEVTPGICRFGPVRQGGVYRMAFFLRNLDVDVTRFNVTVLKSEFVRVTHQPGQIAPGMAAKLVVEIMAKQPGKVEQLVEVRIKAHVIRVPVTARILEAEEYDRLDAESMALHRRHIGRHREKSDAGEKRAVEVVTDEKYCQKVLGDTFRHQPGDFEETPTN